MCGAASALFLRGAWCLKAGVRLVRKGSNSLLGCGLALLPCASWPEAVSTWGAATSGNLLTVARLQFVIWAPPCLSSWCCGEHGMKRFGGCSD